MGSAVMESDDISTYAAIGSTNPLKNLSAICTTVHRVNSRGLFFDSNPLDFSGPLLMAQIAISSGIILFNYKFLKPLGQPIIVSQILGGIIIGPSFLGKISNFSNLVFPLRGFIVLDLLSTFGYMYYFFLIGIHVDPWLLRKLGMKTIVTGISTVTVAMMLSLSYAIIFKRFGHLDPDLAGTLPTVAIQESVLAFPIIAQFLTELKIINSEFGQVAIISSAVSNLFSLGIITFTILSHEQADDKTGQMTTISTAIVVVIVIVFVMRPFIMWLLQQSPDGHPLREDCIYAVFVCVLITGFISQATGLHMIFGPLVLGMALPAGPPLGSALVEKLDFISSWILMPLFFIKNGLEIDIFGVDYKNYMVVQFNILAGFIGKFLGALLPSLFWKMPVKDAVAFGLVMTAQGALELGMFKMMKKAKAINNDAFVIMCTSLLIVTGVVTPIIKHLYDPSRRYAVYKRRTIMDLLPKSELRTLVCIHDQENVPATINLLEAFTSAKPTPTVVYLLQLVELVARANPLLIEHKPTKRRSLSKITPTDQIINAFRYYEQSNRELVSVYPFTAMSSYVTMHDNVCSLALNRRISLIIIPYHKESTTNGALQSSKSGIKIMTHNVLEKAPCSVAILVDRGSISTSRPVLKNWSSYCVAVLFLGGADDREALALGTWMAGHPNINLTMIRLLENGNITSDDMRERKLDNQAVSEFRLSMAGNCRVMYIEEVVMDGSGTVAVITSMEDKYELIMVGRRHDKHSSLISGIADWNEHMELGAIGDILASADFRGNTTVLVVQQHTNVANERQKNYLENLTDQSLKGTEEMIEEEADDILIQSRYIP